MRTFPLLPLLDPRRRGRLPGRTWLVPFLAATLGLSLWLSYEALRTERSHREVAQTALRDYAQMAAWQYARIASETLDDLLDELFDEVPSQLRRFLPPPEAVLREIDYALRRAGCACPALRSPEFVFRFDLRDSTLLALPAAADSASVTRLVGLLTSGPPVPRQRHGIKHAAAGELLAGPAALLYAFTYDDEGAHSAYGMVLLPAALGELFARLFETSELLPPAMTGGAPNDSVLHVAVRGKGGAAFFESVVAYPTALGARDTLGREFGSLVVEASVRPDAAARLIIGGLPRSKLPLILGLLMLTLGVGGAALFQLRRERQLARLRDDFVSGVSHELRTPLAQIRIFAELQEAGKLRTEAERARAVGIIHREARRLTHLVENILRFSRIRRPVTAALVQEEIDVTAVVSDLVESFRPLASVRRTTVETRVEPGLTLIANRDAINQMLVNLLDNAVKYGPPEQTITVEAVRRGGHALFAVEDEGAGIPARHRLRIWKPYERLESEQHARVAGTGIGLAVVAQLAAAHGGRAWVEDTPSGGARFVVQLPLSAVRQDTGHDHPLHETFEA
jgi:signal transduction histidine kinase